MTKAKAVAVEEEKKEVEEESSTNSSAFSSETSEEEEEQAEDKPIPKTDHMKLEQSSRIESSSANSAFSSV